LTHADGVSTICSRTVNCAAVIFMTHGRMRYSKSFQAQMFFTG
jgi:hypothetical protein